jgi:hypothetical protein
MFFFDDAVLPGYRQQDTILRTTSTWLPAWRNINDLGLLREKYVLVQMSQNIDQLPQFFREFIWGI